MQHVPLGFGHMLGQDGGSGGGITFKLTVAGAESNCPSFALKVNASGPP